LCDRATPTLGHVLSHRHSTYISVAIYKHDCRLPCVCGGCGTNNNGMNNEEDKGRRPQDAGGGAIKTVATTMHLFRSCCRALFLLFGSLLLYFVFISWARKIKRTYFLAPTFPPPFPSMRLICIFLPAPSRLSGNSIYFNFCF